MTGGSFEEENKTWDTDVRPIPNFNFGKTNYWAQTPVNSTSTG